MNSIIKNVLFTFAAVVLIGVLGWLVQNQMAKGKTITVNGQGIITAVPDQTTIVVTIRKEGADLDDIVSKSKGNMDAVIAELKTFKINDKDLQTAQYRIDNKYDTTNGVSKWSGYIVTNQLKVFLRDNSKIGQLLGALSGMDGVQIDGPAFGFSNPDQLQLQALKAAVENAHAKAVALAETAGAQLGPVLTITQSGGYVPRPRAAMMNMNRAMVVGSSVPVEQGTDQVTAQVDVVYTLK